MDGAVIGALRAELSANIASFVADMGKASAATGRLNRDFQRNGSMISKTVGGMRAAAGAAAVAIAGVFTVQPVKSSLDYAASIGEVAAQVGVTTRELQVYRYVATQVNLSQEEMEKSLAKLTQSIGKAALGSAQQKKAFEALRLRVHTVDGAVKSTGAVMEELADRVAKIPDPAKRAAVMIELFGRAGQKMLPALENGSRGLNQYARDAERLGLVLDDTAIQKADAAADKMEELNRVLMVKMAGIVADNADSILEMANSVSDLAGAIGDLMQHNPGAIKAVMGALVGGSVGGLPGAAVGGLAGATGGLDDVGDQIRGAQEVANKSRFGVFAVPFHSRESLVKAGRARAAREQAQARPAFLDNYDALGNRKGAVAGASGGGDGDVPAFLASGGGGGENKAKQIAKATQTMRDALADLRREMVTGFDANLPASTEKANQLRERLDDIARSARESGVGVAAFSGDIASLKARIAELETEGLEKEAQAFTRAVEEQARAVAEYDKGGLAPLEARLADVDERYTSLRETIEKQIEENAALASVNQTAAKAMAALKLQLDSLAAAHDKATQAAVAQHQAEQAIANLQAQAQSADISGQIGDLQRARGDGGYQPEGQREMQAIEQQLNADRLDAAIKLREMEALRAEAERAGDEEEVMRLSGLIDLQQQYYDLVSATTAEQIVATQRMQDAWDDFSAGLSDSLTTMISDWKFDLGSIKGVFAQLVNSLFLKPGMDSLSGSITSALSSAFAGGFATGGVIPKGQWGVVGERGPEPIFAGNSDLTVVPNGATGGRGGTQVFNIQTPDANSFRASQRQIMRQGRQRLGMA